MARTTANDQADLAVQRTTSPDEARGTFNPLHVLRIRRGEALDHVALELGGIVVDTRHWGSPGKCESEGVKGPSLGQPTYLRLSIPLRQPHLVITGSARP